MSALPDEFVIYCNGHRGAHHALESILARPVDYSRGGMVPGPTKRVHLDGPGEAISRAYDRLDSTQLRCPVCGETRRIRDQDLDRMIATLAEHGKACVSLAEIPG